MKSINRTIEHLKPSGIRKYFDLANAMEGVISLGVGDQQRGTIGGELLMKSINRTIEHLKPSGIRKYFDLANAMEGVISLGVGDPDVDNPWHISAKAVESFVDAHTHYTANRGLIALRRQIANNYRNRYGIAFDPDSEILVTVGGSEAVDLEILVTVGGSEAVDLCCRTLINPGDEVIVLDPNYVAYEPAILMAGGVPVRIPLTQEQLCSTRTMWPTSPRSSWPAACQCAFR